MIRQYQYQRSRGLVQAFRHVPKASNREDFQTEKTKVARKASIEKNERRRELSAKQEPLRRELRAKIRNLTLSPEERAASQKKLNDLPRDGSRMRVRNRCHETGRPRGVYRDFMLSRISFRQLALSGQIPGIVKASW